MKIEAMNFHMQRIPIHLGIVLVTLLWNLKTPIPLTYGPWPTLYIFITLLYYKIWKYKGASPYLLLLFIWQIFTGIFLREVQNIEAAIATASFILFLNHENIYDKSKLIFSLKVIFAAYFIIGILDYVPQFYVIKEELLAKSIQPSRFRGGSSLATEPSYFTLIMGFLFVSIALLEKEKISNWKLIYYIIGIMLSKSLMGLLFLPYVIIFSQNRIKLIISFSLLFVLLFSSSAELLSGRINHVFNNITVYGLNWMLTDASVQARGIFLFKDFYLSYQFYFLPAGIGNYILAQEIIGIPNFLTSLMIMDYPLKMPGSFMGYYVVELGLLAVIFGITLISLKLFIDRGMRLVFVFLVTIIISTQMISLTFFLLPMVFGIICGMRSDDKEPS